MWKQEFCSTDPFHANIQNNLCRYPRIHKKVTHKDYQTRQWPMLQPFPARTEKLERHIVLEKGFSEKIPRENNVQFIQTILSRSKCFILNLILTEKSPSENSNNF